MDKYLPWIVLVLVILGLIAFSGITPSQFFDSLFDILSKIKI